MEFTEERVKRHLAEVHGFLDLSNLDPDSGMCAPELLNHAQDRLDALAGVPILQSEIAYAQGSIHRERRAYGDAVPFFQKVLQDQPGHIGATVGLGWCLKRTGRLAEAIAPYVDSLQKHPQTAILHYNLACYLSLLGRTAESLSALEQAFKLDQDLRNLVPDENDFDPIREMPEFQRLVHE